MREFNNKTEQNFLLILNKMDEKIEVNLGDYLGQCILNNDRFIQLENRKITLIFNIKNENELNFVKDLSIIISLIEILKNEKSIFTHTNPKILNSRLNESSVESLQQKINSEGSIKANGLTNDSNFQNKIIKNPTNYGRWELPTTLSNYILNYVDEFCYVRPELTEYIKNDFNTAEQLRFKKTLRLTQIATFFSFLGLLIAISLPYLPKIESTIESNSIKSTVIKENEMNKFLLKDRDSVMDDHVKKIKNLPTEDKDSLGLKSLQ